MSNSVSINLPNSVSINRPNSFSATSQCPPIAIGSGVPQAQAQAPVLSDESGQELVNACRSNLAASLKASGADGKSINNSHKWLQPSQDVAMKPWNDGDFGISGNDMPKSTAEGRDGSIVRTYANGVQVLSKPGGQGSFLVKGI